MGISGKATHVNVPEHEREINQRLLTLDDKLTSAPVALQFLQESTGLYRVCCIWTVPSLIIVFH